MIQRNSRILLILLLSGKFRYEFFLYKLIYNSGLSSAYINLKIRILINNRQKFVEIKQREAVPLSKSSTIWDSY